MFRISLLFGYSYSREPYMSIYSCHLKTILKFTSLDVATESYKNCGLKFFKSN